MMNLGKLTQSVLRLNLLEGSSLPAIPSLSVPSQVTSLIQKANFSSLLNRLPATRSILAPPVPALTTQVAGLKVRYALKRRCKDCYIVVRHERTYIMCPTHPRHKQVQPAKKPRYTWILTGASQSKFRQW